jgi:predicted RecB family nuclease
MKITSDLFDAFLKCPTKCYLRSTGQTGAGNAYAEWVREQNDAHRKEAMQRLVTLAEGEVAVTTPDAANLKTVTWRLALDLPLETETMASRLHAVERVPSEGRGRPAQFVPVRFTFFNKLSKDDRLLVAFDALVLSEVLGREVSVGKIIHGDDHATLKVKVTSLSGTVRKLTGKMSAMLAAGSPPDLVLNRHCGECEFRDGCRQKALEKDDLSLLGGMSAKERQKLRSKGIFTVTQLSYTFRPRRRPKRQRDKREKYHHSLKALAIREKKIHIVGSPELKIEGTPVYLDVEGLPDRDFYYLIGVRVGDGESAVQHSLWAESVEEEGRIWREFVAIVEAVEKPVLIHYGSYETTYLKRMCEMYAAPLEGSLAEKAIESSQNLLSVVFAQVYFPTFGNGLKDVAGFLGFKWSEPNPSGLNTIVWRTNWQDGGWPEAREKIMAYNTQDCSALAIVTHAVSQLCNSAEASGSEAIPVVHTEHLPKETMWPRFVSPIPEFEQLNKAARWDYQHDRIYTRMTPALRKPRAGNKPKKGWRNLRPSRTIRSPVQSLCPICSKKGTRRDCVGRRVLHDLHLTRGGVRRKIIEYEYTLFRCPSCKLSYGYPKEFLPGRRFGRNLLAYLIYHVVELCIPMRTVRRSVNRFLGLELQPGVIRALKTAAAAAYEKTRSEILEKLAKGSLVQVDETRASIKGKTGYVWVFASLSDVAYVYSDSREGQVVQRILNGFHGVLVSDFFSAYDAIPCPQQKCLLHLIRDLNDEVLNQPYDEELKAVVRGFAEVLQGAVATVDRFGLKKRFLRKHRTCVERFYRRINKANYTSGAAKKCVERLEKNRDKLFTFLDYDGVPWNNNNAEHAIKAFAGLRDIMEGSWTAKSIDQDLVLLSICETCRWMGVDFLDFLRSGEKDIHAFAESRRRRRRPSPNNEPKALPSDDGAQK